MSVSRPYEWLNEPVGKLALLTGRRYRSALVSVMALVAVLVAVLVITECPAALADEAPRGPTCRHAQAAQDLRGRAIVRRKNEVSEEAGRSVQIAELVGRQRPLSGRLRTHLQHVLGRSDHHDRHSVVDMDDIAVLELLAPRERDDELALPSRSHPQVRSLALGGGQLHLIDPLNRRGELGDLPEHGGHDRNVGCRHSSPPPPFSAGSRAGSTEVSLR